MLLDDDSPYGALLVQVYGNDLWELLENGNYELLADQVFESQEKMVGCMLLDLCVGCDVFKASSFGLHVIQRPIQFYMSFCPTRFFYEVWLQQARASIVTSSASDVRDEEGPSSNVQLDKKLGHLESGVQPPLLGENSVKHPGVPQTHGSLSVAAIGEAPPKQSGVSAGKVFRKLVASDVSCPKKQLGSSTTLKKEKPVKRQLESMVADLCTQKEKLVKREHGPTVVTELHATGDDISLHATNESYGGMSHLC